MADRRRFLAVGDQHQGGARFVGALDLAPVFLPPPALAVRDGRIYGDVERDAVTGNDRFRLTFESDRTRVVIYTDGAHPTCTMAGTGLGCFEPTLEMWRYIAGSNPHASVRVTVDGAAASAPATFYRSSTLAVGFSRGPVPGAIYY